EYRTCLFAAPPPGQNCAVCGRSRTPARPHSRSADVLVAFEPGAQCARDDIRRMREVAGHQRIDARERRGDRLAARALVGAAVRERVLELDLAGEDAGSEGLPARRVRGVLGPDLHHDFIAGVVDHSRIAWSPGRSTWTLSSTDVTQLSGM